MFELDMRSGEPIYEQLVYQFKRLIIEGVMEVDEKLPSVRDLAGQLTVNPNTIQKAYRELEAEGYIYSVKGRGSFVQQREEQSNTAKIEEMKKRMFPLLREAFYLGMTREELEEIIRDANGGMDDD
ncbi:GntR family transcriptional regulator [Salimicrobium flavidum]|uniref:GntR family transcriptional regulator n=1 Tax=Salimicrobium flavidum TaxID=570947 RepID=A0A1N7K8R3_9BACI|nr:GntR family transcriptional regulator [Salimicrobium flavidum]SIS57943.1 GntR family transcriptional regulator [Salimicrobium flavidum]